MKRKTAIISAVILFLLYVIIGSTVPFIHQPKYREADWESTTVSNLNKQVNGLRAGIIESNKEALAIRLRMIEDAKERIILSTFDIRPGNSSEDIFSALLAAADRGVKVQILVDGLYGSLHMSGESQYYAAGTHKNIEIRFYNTPNLLKPWTVHGRLHDKYLIVDHNLLLLGGRNTFDYFLGENGNNGSLDREVLMYLENGNSFEDTVIKKTYSYFESVWNLKECKPVFENVPLYIKNVEQAREALRLHYSDRKESYKYNYADITVPVDNAVLLTNPTHIYAKEPVVFQELTALMGKAEEKVIIQTPYAVFSADMYKAMTKAAVQQPNIHMLVNSTAVGDNFMASSDYTLNRKKLLKTGINLYEFHGSHSTHGKSVLVDEDVSVIMSYNFDMRSTYIDTETALVIRGEEFNSLLEYNMEQLNKESVRVNADGMYEIISEVELKVLPAVKKALFTLTSVVFQLFRFLL